MMALISGVANPHRVSFGNVYSALKVDAQVRSTGPDVDTLIEVRSRYVA